MKSIVLTHDLLIGSMHHLKGDAVDLDDTRAESLIRSGYAVPTDAAGEPESRSPTVETASRSPKGRRAARLIGKAE